MTLKKYYMLVVIVPWIVNIFKGTQQKSFAEKCGKVMFNWFCLHWPYRTWFPMKKKPLPWAQMISLGGLGEDRIWHFEKLQTQPTISLLSELVNFECKDRTWWTPKQLGIFHCPKFEPQLPPQGVLIFSDRCLSPVTPPLRLPPAPNPLASACPSLFSPTHHVCFVLVSLTFLTKMTIRVTFDYCWRL